MWLSLNFCSWSVISKLIYFLTSSFRSFGKMVMIQSVYSFIVSNSSPCLSSWSTWSLKYILADFGMRYWSSLNQLRFIFFFQIQWWYVTCFVTWLFNGSAKFSRRDAVWRLMKASMIVLGGCLLLVEPCKTDGSKRVCFLTLLGVFAVFIMFVIYIYLFSSPFSLYSLRTQ